VGGFQRMLTMIIGIKYLTFAFLLSSEVSVFLKNSYLEASEIHLLLRLCSQRRRLL
jgi:hypothetical protein